jgi:hypothetical protein
MKIREMGEGHGEHHPYCKWVYENTNWVEWKCICDILKGYDRWKHSKEL